MREPVELVAFLRSTLKLTQAQLSETLGVSQALVSMWESGKAMPAPEHWVGMGNLMPYPYAENYYYCGGMEGRRVLAIKRGVRAILQFIGNFDQTERRALELAIEGKDADEQLDRVTQALDDFSQNVKGTKVAVRLADEDRKLLNDTAKAIEKLKSWRNEGESK